MGEQVSCQKRQTSWSRPLISLPWSRLPSKTRLDSVLRLFQSIKHNRAGKSRRPRPRTTARRWCRILLPKRFVPRLCAPSISQFRKVGISVFGPSALAARMEGSKAFSKAFMARHAIPTAKFQVFSSAQFGDAVAYVKTCGHPVVLKADGLAAGKGVLLPETTEEAIKGLHEILVDNVFSAAGQPSCPPDIPSL